MIYIGCFFARFPPKLRSMCHCLYQVVTQRFQSSLDTVWTVIGTVIFLRFINPALGKKTKNKKKKQESKIDRIQCCCVGCFFCLLQLWLFMIRSFVFFTLLVFCLYLILWCTGICISVVQVQLLLCCFFFGFFLIYLPLDT